MQHREKKQLTVTEPLDLRFLPDEGLHFDDALNVEWLNGQLSDASTIGPMSAIREGRAELDVEPMGPVQTRPPIRLHGEVSASVSTSCVRCLEPVEEHLEAHVDLTLFPADVARPKKGEEDDEAMEGAEMEEGSYAGNEIDLPALVREALVLELSMNPVCSDEEACTGRTEKMLAEANRASQGVIPDRWAALRHLVPNDTKN